MRRHPRKEGQVAANRRWGLAPADVAIVCRATCNKSSTYWQVPANLNNIRGPTLQPQLTYEQTIDNYECFVSF